MKATTQAKINAILKRYEKEGAMILRRCWYVLLGEELIQETKSGYNNLSRLLVKLRLDGSLPWEVIIDNTRKILQRTTYSSFDEGFEVLCDYFYFDSMVLQDNYVEVWVEKDTAAASIYNLTQPLDVPLIVARGFSSVTYMKNAVDRFRSINKPIHIIYVSDFDPEGNYFPELFKKQLTDRYNFTGNITIHKTALTQSDIEKNKLHWIPLVFKKARSKEKQMQKQYFRSYLEEFGLKKVELDALAGDVLAEKIKGVLTKLIDFKVVERSNALSRKAVKDWKKKNLRSDY